MIYTAYGDWCKWHCFTHMSSVQNPSIIPLNLGWGIGIPLLDYSISQYIGEYNPRTNHQPPGV